MTEPLFAPSLVQRGTIIRAAPISCAPATCRARNQWFSTSAEQWNHLRNFDDPQCPGCKSESGLRPRHQHFEVATLCHHPEACATKVENQCSKLQSFSKFRRHQKLQGKCWGGEGSCLLRCRKLAKMQIPGPRPPEFLILQAWGGAREFMFLTRTQVMLMLLQGATLSTTAPRRLLQSSQLPLQVALLPPSRQGRGSGPSSHGSSQPS